MVNLASPARRRFAGAEPGSRVLQAALSLFRERMRGAEDTPRDPFRVLEHVHGLALFFARRAGVTAEPRRVSCQHPERGLASLSEYTSRHGDRLAQQ